MCVGIIGSSAALADAANEKLFVKVGCFELSSRARAVLLRVDESSSRAQLFEKLKDADMTHCRKTAKRTTVKLVCSAHHWSNLKNLLKLCHI